MGHLIDPEVGVEQDTNVTLLNAALLEDYICTKPELTMSGELKKMLHAQGAKWVLVDGLESINTYKKCLDLYPFMFRTELFCKYVGDNIIFVWLPDPSERADDVGMTYTLMDGVSRWLKGGRE